MWQLRHSSLTLACCVTFHKLNWIISNQYLKNNCVQLMHMGIYLFLFIIIDDLTVV